LIFTGSLFRKKLFETTNLFNKKDDNKWSYNSITTIKSKRKNKGKIGSLSHCIWASIFY